MFAGTLLGPLHTQGAVKEYTDGLAEIAKQGGKILYGGNVKPGPGFFVEPTIVSIDASAPIVKEELFVPILYILKCKVRPCWIFRQLTPSLRLYVRFLMVGRLVVGVRCSRSRRLSR